MARQIEIKDDRIIYLAVRWRGDKGVLVEGGFNGEFDFLDATQRGFVLKLAFEALMANTVATMPEDEELRKFRDWFERHTDLGKPDINIWRDTPPTPPDSK